MMKKRKETYHWTDQAAEKIAGAGIKLQRRFAEAMRKQASTMSPQRLKRVLIGFCLAGAGFSFYIAGDAIFGDGQHHTVIEVKPIHVPQHVDRTGSEIKVGGNAVPESLYNELQQYKRSMDSLGQTIRPGLADSIRRLEEIYHSQNN